MSLFPFTRHLLGHIWTTPYTSGQRASSVREGHSAEAPRMVRVGALVPWGKAEGPGLVQPGAGAALGAPCSSPVCLWGGCWGEWPPMHGQEEKGNLQKLKQEVQTAHEEQIFPHKDSPALGYVLLGKNWSSSNLSHFYLGNLRRARNDWNVPSWSCLHVRIKRAVSSHGLWGIMSPMLYAVTFLFVYGIARERNARLSEATSFPFINPVDMLASVNILEVFQFSVLGGL